MGSEITTGALAELFDTTPKTIADLAKRKIIAKPDLSRRSDMVKFPVSLHHIAKQHGSVHPRPGPKEDARCSTDLVSPLHA
jgi:hypothetical protein